MTRRRIAAAIAGLAVIGALVAVELLSGSSTSTTGRVAPELPREVLVPPQTTFADLCGKPALINFWASWCDPCRKEAPELERFARSLNGEGQLVGGRLERQRRQRQGLHRGVRTDLSEPS